MPFPKNSIGPNYKEWFDIWKQEDQWPTPYPPMKPIRPMRPYEDRLPKPGSPWSTNDDDYYKRIWERGDEDADKAKREKMERIKDLIDKARGDKKKPTPEKKKKPKKRKPSAPKKERRVPEGTRDLDIDF